MEDYQVADADTPLPTLVGPGNFCVAVRNPAVAAVIADELNRLLAEIERLREERRWIPVGERLPEDEADVICGYAGFKSFPGYRQGFNWFDERDSHLAFPPTHWMPLPEPPREE